MNFRLKFLAILFLIFLIILGAEVIYRSSQTAWADVPAVNADIAIEEVVPLSQLQKVAEKSNLPQLDTDKINVSAPAARNPAPNSSNLTRAHRLAGVIPPPHPVIEQFKDLYLPWAAQFRSPSSGNFRIIPV